MWRDEFETYLRRSGRSDSAVGRVLARVDEFEAFLGQGASAKGLDNVAVEDLEDFVASIEAQPKASAKLHLWALIYYFDFDSNLALRDRARQMRSDRIKRKPFKLVDFRGVDQAYAALLAAAGIEDIEQMREAGRTAQDRLALSERTGVPAESILEFTKLSDLSRIGGVKSIRARLYFDAGVDSVEKLASWEPEELRSMLIEFVERTGFDGIAPTPKEARNAVNEARRFPITIEY